MKTPTRHIPNTDAGTRVKSRVVATKPCKLFTVVVDNGNVAAQYLQIHETASLPANGQAPVMPSIRVPASTTLSFDISAFGVDLAACTIAMSSTSDTLTLIGTADCQLSAIVAG